MWVKSVASRMMMAPPLFSVRTKVRLQPVDAGGVNTRGVAPAKEGEGQDGDMTSAEMKGNGSGQHVPSRHEAAYNKSGNLTT